jgi:hypothetical protein
MTTIENLTENKKSTDDTMQFTADVSKQILKLRNEYGLKSVRQNYKGTGSQRANRQLFISFSSGDLVDVWLKDTTYKIGGVTQLRVRGEFPYSDKTPSVIAKDVCEWLKKLSEVC